MPQLPADCLNEIFEYLGEDKVTLRSCLLVNCLWCEVSVRILWRTIRNYNTLIACLPNESKEILYKNGIITSTSASEPPMFNYASFCKILLVYQVESNIKISLSQNSKDSQYILIREIFKLLMSQISSLVKLDCYFPFREENITFTSFPGANDCLKNLSELHCYSDTDPELFYQLSQICRNIQSLIIEFVEVISNGLADLISAQQNLKHLYIMQYSCGYLTADIIASLTKLPDTLIKLDLYGGESHIPLSFIDKFSHLQEIILSFDFRNAAFEDFKKLQHVTFSHLQVLKFQYESPSNELLIKFLENNGRNLKEFYVNYNTDDLLNLAIAKFCPNLRKLFTGFNDNELETLKIIFDSCQYLESIKIWCCDGYLNEKVLFDVLVTHSPKNFYELKLCYSYVSKSDLLPDELESFFTSWTNRISQKSFSLIIIHNDSDSLDKIYENMEIIKKFIRLGIIKEFKTIEYYFESD